ncbi:uncharacterized protein LOC115096477 [Rhinatrema bivittatum]|uniref:uncharacterized protein LOC115096477 n=1 Tax=Rhinatrema bivittatum TaxID=194408 RepID=UPI0011283467|nr:uncharacterized protein LOC115096477 [Rhinatrema bivittatum]XP_029466988.1 uncharacterized protein LOC115096477 [Rhinatrema bivittatum]
MPPENPALARSNHEVEGTPTAHAAIGAFTAGSIPAALAVESPGYILGQLQDIEQGARPKEPGLVSKGTVPKQVGGISVLTSVTRPSVFTLENIWDAILELKALITQQVSILTLKCGDLEGKMTEITNMTTEHEQQLISVRVQSNSVQQTQTALIKENINLNMRIEALENSVRNRNLRLINFPKLPLIPPREMFKRYLVEVLKVPENVIPPVSKIYYLPQLKKAPENQRGEQVDDEVFTPLIPVSEPTLDVSALLETSDSEMAVPATLIVTLTLEPDKEWLLKLYFRHRTEQFLHHRVKIFPDVARQTRKKRKQFLLMRTQVQQIGEYFFLSSHANA